MPRPTPPSDPAHLLATRARALARHHARARKGEASGVHQARVASRRLREAVPVLTAGRKGVGRGWAMRRLRELTRALGAVRESDVTLDLIHELGGRERLPAAAVDELRARVEQARERRCERQLDAVGRLDVKKLTRRLDTMAGAVADGQRSGGWRTALAARLVSRAKALAQAAGDAGHLYEPERLHTVRIAVKKLRYALELSRETGTATADPPIRRLRAIQDLLGRLHDLQVLAAHVAAVQADPSPHVPMDQLDAAARTLEAECRHLHAKYLSVAPGIDLVVADTRRLAADVAAGRARSRKAAPPSRRRTAARDVLSA
jgi:CHAD domain-containing protein